MKNTQSTKKIRVYTDGACKPNPGPGGWGAVIVYPDKKNMEMSGGDIDTTNNRMELMAAIKALDELNKDSDIILFTDSQYIRKGITKWVNIWKVKNWKTIEGTDVKNMDLWKELIAKAGLHKINWKWIKGHAGHKYNERADELARKARKNVESTPLPLDDKNAIHIFTAVSYSTKTKNGAWVACLSYQQYEKCINGFEKNSSGNRMHIISAIQGLEQIKKNYPVHIYTVSDYLKDGASKWILKWANKNWQTIEGEKVKHKDLWIKLQKISQKYKISWHLVSKKNFPEQMSKAKDIAIELLKHEQKEMDVNGVNSAAYNR